jgi:hypothetical protein
MENTIDNPYETGEPVNQRPDFLKIICILSFVGCGLMILLCSLGTMAFAVDEATIDKVWPQIVEGNPQFADVDPMTFMHAIGMICVYTLIANVFSLIGVIMMWRLERLGILIYAIAELSTNFFSFDVGVEQKNSYGGTIFSVAIDLVFIGMYLANMKYMKKKNNNNYVQSGS